MWTCPKCGEPHDDHFKLCWKCASDEPEPAAASTGIIPEVPARFLGRAGDFVEGHRAPSAQSTERKVRPFSSVVFRAAVAFVIGAIGGMAIFHRSGASLEEAMASGLVAGGVTAIVVGVFVWVVFPYEPTRGPDEDAALRP